MATKHTTSAAPTTKRVKQRKLYSSSDEQQQQQRDHSSSSSSSSSWKVFCDLDGVLCDFNAGFRNISGGRYDHPDDVPHVNVMWKMIARSNAFYQYLPWTTDGKELWDAIRHLSPDILTGVPRHWSARTEKVEWCRRELGGSDGSGGVVAINHVDMAAKQRSHQIVRGRRKDGVVNVITCWSRNKHMESGFRAVLIDDRENLGRDWEARGGIFVHHTDTKRTLQQLKDLGIIESGFKDDEEEEKTTKAEEKEEKQIANDEWMMNMYDERPDTP